MATDTSKQPTVFIPHGGGPCFFMDWNPPDTWRTMETWLRQYASTLPSRPKSILIVSGHWEEPIFTIGSNLTPTLIYDYYGFPPHTYQLTYPVTGDQSLVHRVKSLLKESDIEAREDKLRGLDHGVFIPLKLIYPDADIPIVQLSLKAGLVPSEHIALGKAISILRCEGVLIVGSGMSYHNLHELMSGGSTVKTASEQFDFWLNDVIYALPETRNAMLTEWGKAPSARKAHPREEHLMPLMVVAGAAGLDIGRRIYHDSIMHSLQSAYQFG